jgi:hypothetical protein
MWRSAAHEEYTYLISDHDWKSVRQGETLADSGGRERIVENNEEKGKNKETNSSLVADLRCQHVFICSTVETCLLLL